MKFANSCLILLLFSILSVGCVRPNPPKGFESINFSEVTKHEEMFLNLDFEKQYEVYNYVMSAYHPKLSFYADFMARQGDKVVPYLEAKLVQESDERRQQNIIYVFYMMKFLKYYDVSDNICQINIIKAKISSMKNKNRIEKSSWFLNEILQTENK